MADYTVLDDQQLRHFEHTDELEGEALDMGVSLILVDMPPGAGMRLHRHSYQEVFIVQQGRATYTVGAEAVQVSAPQVVVVQAGVPHGFVNSGEVRLRQVDIHLSKTIVTEWL